MQIKLGKQAGAAIAAAAAREGLSIEEFVLDAALRRAGVRGDELDPQDLLILVEKAVGLAAALPVDAPFKLADLVEGQAWWDDLAAASRLQVVKLFRQAMQNGGFIEFNSREPDKAIYMRVK